MSASEWAAWAALGVSLILLASLVAGVVLALRAWHKVAPSVLPLVSMFGGPATTASTATSTSEPPAMPIALVDPDDD